MFLTDIAKTAIESWNYGNVPAWLAFIVSLWGLRVSYSTKKRTEVLENRREESLYRCEMTDVNQLTVSNHNEKNPMLNVTVVRPKEDLTKDSIAPKASHVFTLVDGDAGNDAEVMFKILKQDWVVTPGQDARREAGPPTAALKIRTWINIKMGKLPHAVKSRWEELRRRS
jgi:hypothetical protein